MIITALALQSVAKRLVALIYWHLGPANPKIFGTPISSETRADGGLRCRHHCGSFRPLWKRHRKQRRGMVFSFAVTVQVAWAQSHSINNNKGERSQLGLHGLWQHMLAALPYYCPDDVLLSCILLQPLVIPDSQPGWSGSISV